MSDDFPSVISWALKRITQTDCTHSHSFSHTQTHTEAGLIGTGVSYSAATPLTSNQGVNWTCSASERASSTDVSMWFVVNMRLKHRGNPIRQPRNQLKTQLDVVPFVESAFGSVSESPVHTSGGRAAAIRRNMGTGSSSSVPVSMSCSFLHTLSQLRSLTSAFSYKRLNV